MSHPKVSSMTISDSIFNTFTPQLTLTGSFSNLYNGTGFGDINNPTRAGFALGEIVTITTVITVPYGSFNLSFVDNQYNNQPVG